MAHRGMPIRSTIMTRPVAYPHLHSVQRTRAILVFKPESQTYRYDTFQSIKDLMIHSLPGPIDWRSGSHSFDSLANPPAHPCNYLHKQRTTLCHSYWTRQSKIKIKAASLSISARTLDVQQRRTLWRRGSSGREPNNTAGHDATGIGRFKTSLVALSIKSQGGRQDHGQVKPTDGQGHSTHSFPTSAQGDFFVVGSRTTRILPTPLGFMSSCKTILSFDHSWETFQATVYPSLFHRSLTHTHRQGIQPLDTRPHEASTDLDSTSRNSRIQTILCIRNRTYPQLVSISSRQVHTSHWTIGSS